jgi:hypothetical protein
LVGTHWKSPHFILFETDDVEFGGHQRLNEGHGKWTKTIDKEWAKRRNSMKLYIPARTAIVLAPFEFAIKYKDLKLPHYDPEDADFKSHMPNQASKVEE